MPRVTLEYKQVNNLLVTRKFRWFALNVFAVGDRLQVVMATSCVLHTYDDHKQTACNSQLGSAWSQTDSRLTLSYSQFYHCLSPDPHLQSNQITQHTYPNTFF